MLDDFTVDKARHNRISDKTRAGYKSGINQIINWLRSDRDAHTLEHLLIPSGDTDGGATLNLQTFTYNDFLQFLNATVKSKRVEVATLSGYRSALKSLYRDQRVQLPKDYGDDMKEIFSGKSNCLLMRFT